MLALAPAIADAQSGARDTTVRLSSGAVVDITMRTGRIIVRGVDGSTGSVRSGGNDYRVRSDGVSLAVTAREGEDNERERPFELDVPRGVRLVVNTTSADVDIRDITGDVEVRTVNGDLRLDGISGRLYVDTFNGDVFVTGAPGPVRIVTVSGDAQVRGARGDVELRTTSGDLLIAGSALSRLTMASISGDLHVDGSFTESASVQVSTHSGDITLRVPDTARGRLELSTSNGKLTTAGPLTLMPGDVSGARRGRSTRRYEFGGGGALHFDITTFSGDVRFLRGIRS
jgi:hypothetical protein